MVRTRRRAPITIMRHSSGSAPRRFSARSPGVAGTSPARGCRPRSAWAAVSVRSSPRRRCCRSRRSVRRADRGRPAGCGRWPGRWRRAGRVRRRSRPSARVGVSVSIAFGPGPPRQWKTPGSMNRRANRCVARARPCGRAGRGSRRSSRTARSPGLPSRARGGASRRGAEGRQVGVARVVDAGPPLDLAERPPSRSAGRRSVADGGRTGRRGTSARRCRRPRRVPPGAPVAVRDHPAGPVRLRAHALAARVQPLAALVARAGVQLAHGTDLRVGEAVRRGSRSRSAGSPDRTCRRAGRRSGRRPGRPLRRTRAGRRRAAREAWRRSGWAGRRRRCSPWRASPRTTR